MIDPTYDTISPAPERAEPSRADAGRADAGRPDAGRADEARANQILRALLSTGSVTVAELAAQFAVTPMTVRRDLVGLERRGLLRRTRGGAVAIQPLLYEPFRHEPSFNEQVERYADEKRRIGLAAAELVANGDTIALTPGTTTTQVSRSLHARRGLTVVTNTVNVAMELSTREDVAVFVTGGFLRGGWFSLVGPAAQQGAGELFADTVFISASGVHAEHGLTGLYAEETAVARAMLRQARRRVVVADRSKLGVVEKALICPAREAHVLITDRGATDAMVAPFEALGVEVRRV
jgi:DeoR family transcriptional regulator of aga operon